MKYILNFDLLFIMLFILVFDLIILSKEKSLNQYLNNLTISRTILILFWTFNHTSYNFILIPKTWVFIFLLIIFNTIDINAFLIILRKLNSNLKKKAVWTQIEDYEELTKSIADILLLFYKAKYNLSRASLTKIHYY